MVLFKMDDKNYIEVEDEFKPETFEDWINQGYKELNFFSKLLYHLQDHIILTIFSSLIVGYLAGTYFGKFW